ncbi:PREDICTED: lysM and putative peptidoglycan-binding domain-containing protein 1 [Nanorana parkeri]|uniref:lysM and putative peptidoglycan-binding domain-containing protein 1 n=1 Tax=Nanorana parkeri TaxID=125878 RepID=UPI000854FD92|nr:PREDICTED: lysM and putative peptidoglycan-binding domain-containing protein 1 [Nanorana parkeri]
MASSTPGDSGLLRGTRARSYGSMVHSPARIRKVEHLVVPGDTLQGLALKYGVTVSRGHLWQGDAGAFAARGMLGTLVRQQKANRAAVKKIREGESIGAAEEDAVSVVGYQNPSFSRSREGSPQTQQRSLLGPVPLTVTPRASALRDREDEIFKL